MKCPLHRTEQPLRCKTGSGWCHSHSKSLKRPLQCEEQPVELKMQNAICLRWSWMIAFSSTLVFHVFFTFYVLYFYLSFSFFITLFFCSFLFLPFTVFYFTFRYSFTLCHFMFLLLYLCFSFIYVCCSFSLLSFCCSFTCVFLVLHFRLVVSFSCSSLFFNSAHRFSIKIPFIIHI